MDEYKKIETLYRLSRIVTSTIRLNELLEIVLDEVIKNLGADGGSILLLEDGELVIRASRGLPKSIVEKTCIPIGDKISGRIAKMKRPYLFINGLFPEGFKGVRVRPRIRSSICVPLLFMDEVIGVLCINRTRPEKDFTEDELELLWLFGTQASQAISNARFYEELERKVKEKTMELEEANRRLLELDKMKSVFLDTVSHELRSPLTSIKSYSEILLKEEVDEGTRRDFLEIIDKEVDRLRRIIDDLLDLSRIERGRLRFRRIDLSRIINEAVGRIRPMADGKRIRMNVSVQDSLPKIKGEKEGLFEVFWNLLDNAIKFNHEGGSVMVKVIKEGDHIKVSIKDTGIGIGKEHLERVFDRFFQVHRDREGTGLGLSIVKGIILQHLGRIWVESELGKGTTFHFTLPIS